MPKSLESLLERARVAAPNERIDLRDEIAGHGEDGIRAMIDWLADAELWRFAIKVMGRAAELGHRESAIGAMRETGTVVPRAQRAAIDAELARLGAPGVVRSGSYGPIDDGAIRDRLIAAAKKGEVVHYADLARATGREMKGPNWAAHIGRILGRISSEESDAGRPLLSVIVVSRDTKLPGGGFFNLGQELQLVEPGEDEQAFIARQTRRVYEFWQAKGKSSSP